MQPHLGLDGLELYSQPFRTIHYLGSKRRLLTSITQHLDQLAPPGTRVCDLFAGSGVVTQAIAASRPVLSVDIQAYSKALCSAIVSPVKPTPVQIAQIQNQIFTAQLKFDLLDALADVVALESEAIALAKSGHGALLNSLMLSSPLHIFGVDAKQTGDSRIGDALHEANRKLVALGLENSPSTSATRYFGGVYFSYRQAIMIDVALSIAALPDFTFEKELVAACLCTASDIVSSIGKQFAQPLSLQRRDGTIKQNLVKQAVRDRTIDVDTLLAEWLFRFSNFRAGAYDHSVLQVDYREALANSLSDVSAVYADPPYTRDHYSRFYHVLETLALRDNPSVSTTNIRTRGSISRGLYRQDRHQSPFCIKSKAKDAFTELFASVSARDIPLLLSYSPYSATGSDSPRMLSVGDLSALARTHFRDVSVLLTSGVTHSRFNSAEFNQLPPTGAELFLICRP